MRVLGTWALAGCAAAAALVSPSAQAQIAYGRLDVRLVVQKSCTVTPRTQDEAARESDPAVHSRDGGAVSVACSENTPYFIDTTSPERDDLAAPGGRSAQPYSVEVTPPSATPGTARRTRLITLHY